MTVIRLPEEEFAANAPWLRHALLVAALASAKEEGAMPHVPSARLGLPPGVLGASLAAEA